MCKNGGHVHKSLALRVAWLHSSSVVHACHVVLFERSTSKGEENQSALLKRWHRGFTLLFRLCSARSSHLSDVNMSVSQPSPKTNPRPSQPSSSSSRPSLCSDLPSRPSSVVTIHHLSALMHGTRCPYGPIQCGLAGTYWPHMEPFPQG